MQNLKTDRIMVYKKSGDINAFADASQGDCLTSRNDKIFIKWSGTQIKVDTIKRACPNSDINRLFVGPSYPTEVPR